MQTVKAVYTGNKTIKLLTDVDLEKGTELELTLEIPERSDKSELGQRIIRSLKDAVSGRVRVINSAKELDAWAEEIGD